MAIAIDSLTNHAFQRNQIAARRVILIGMLFVSFLIMSNLTAFKIAQIQLIRGFSIEFPAALIFFPLTYFFDDVLTEVYGFKLSRLIIWCGLACSAIVSLCTWITVQLPAAPIWDAGTNHGAAAYALTFNGSTRVFFASTLSYFFGEFLNSMILAKLKVLTTGKYFSLRIMGSTAIGVGIDSILFTNLAFWNVLPQAVIWKIILVQYVFKISYEFLMLPVTWQVTNYLKRVDNIDYYDTNTKLNPFSLRLTD
jgi:uncharacterized integral membrane protein (TIGR00697 family)